MKNSIRAIASILTAALVLFVASPARALTNEDIAGIYQGTSTATLANGATVTASVKITFKPKGRIKTTATVNGQTSASKGNYQFVSGDVILGSFPTGEFTAFVDLDGSNMTFTLLVRAGDGSIISERTSLTLVEKL